MASPRYHHALAVLDGELHAIGGMSRSSETSVEKYDSRTDCWSIVPGLVPMAKRGQDGFAAAVTMWSLC